MQTRIIPGTLSISGRNFMYIQGEDENHFEKIFREMGELIRSLKADKTQFPQSGGMITENVEIITPDGISFFGISYKGDLKNWEKCVRTFANDRNLKLAIPFQKVFQVENGRAYSFDECSVNFYQK
jgi:hypothetical protein